MHIVHLCVCGCARHHRIGAHWPRELVYHLQVDTLLIAGKLASINFITITQDLWIYGKILL